MQEKPTVKTTVWSQLNYDTIRYDTTRHDI